jgi:hypothetical protein
MITLKKEKELDQDGSIYYFVYVYGSKGYEELSAVSSSMFKNIPSEDILVDVEVAKETGTLVLKYTSSTPLPNDSDFLFPDEETRKIHEEEREKALKENLEFISISLNQLGR